MMFMRTKTFHRKLDELEEQLYLNYKKLNLTVLDARRQQHVFEAIRKTIR
jgi:hypothetical protein